MSGASHRAAFLLAAVCLLSPWPAPAHGQADEPTLEDWLEAALQRDPEVLEAWAESDYEAGRIASEAAYDDPELRLSSENRTDRGDQTALGLRVRVPNPWEVRSLRRRAAARADAELQRAEAVEWERRTALSILYYDALAAFHQFSLRAELVSGLAADLEIARMGRDNAVLSEARFLELMGEHAVAGARLAEDEMQWHALREELCARAGWEPGTVAALASHLPDPAAPEPLPELADCRSRAFLASRPLAALDAEERENRALLAGERSAGIPWITFLEAAWVRENERDRDDIEAQIGISLPVFSWLRRSHTEAAFRILRTSEQQAAQRAALESALASAWHRADAARRRLVALHSTSSPALQRIESALPVPGMDPRSRSRLRELVYNLRQSRLEAAFDYQCALADLRGITGPGPAQPLANP